MLGPEEEDRPQLREEEHCHIRARKKNWKTQQQIAKSKNKYYFSAKNSSAR